MNFFKSILSDDSNPHRPENLHESDPNSPLKPPRDDDNSSDADDGDPADGWSFGGLIKTLAIESVIETYRRDLQEFGSGLKKETAILRETASRAVKDLPASIEASASAAHGVLKSTAEMISKESLVFASDGEPQTPETSRSLNSGRYSWFEAQLSAIQSDSSTFCEEPEDLEEYRKWKLGFELEKNRDEIDSLIGGNGSLEGVYRRFVPSAVDPETFWCRYFYRVDKLKQQESVRANLVKRAISVDDDDEELSWDVDDDDDVEDGNGGDESGLNVKGGNVVGENVSTINGNLKPVEKQEGSNSGSPDDNVGGNAIVGDGEKSNVVEPSSKSSVDVSSGEKEVSSEVVELRSDENVKPEESFKEKNDEEVSVEEKSESCKKSDSSVVSSHQPKAVEKEEDLEWDEIEDIGSGDERKMSGTTKNGSVNRAELRKRLSGEEDDDDDLNWDIEDDDEPVKA